MKKPQEFNSAQEWADSYRREAPPPAVVRRGIPGPGWLDDDTPCACSRAYVMQLGRTVSSHLIEHLISRPLNSRGVCTYDPMGKGTKEQ